MKSYSVLPHGYRTILDINLQKDKKLALLINGLALLIGILLVVPMLFVVPIATLFTFEYGFLAYFARFGVLTVGLVAYMILHEWVHGITMKLCGTKHVKYGFTGMYAFAGSPDYYGKSAYIAIALAPVIVWGAVLATVNAVVPTAWFWVVYIIQVCNLSGAAGDIYVTAKFSRFPSDILVRDYGVSMTVYSVTAKAETVTHLDKRIEESRTAIARTTVKLVNIKSVQEPPLADAPFGAGPRTVLDAVLQMGRDLGFICTDYGVGVVSLALNDTPPDLGIWVHGDVVPEGDGWIYPPYDATEVDGCIIGRGATDNKGQLAAILHLLHIIKEENIDLGFNPALYVGSNEETGMADLTAFLEKHTPPRLSLVPDEGFPVVYGGKGGMKVHLTATTPLCDVRITAGLSDAPGRAVAEFVSGTAPIVTDTPPVHSAHPDSDNAIAKLAVELLKNDTLCPTDRATVSVIQKLALDMHGETVGIAAVCEDMSPLTMTVYQVTTENEYPTVSLNIRYPITTTYETVLETLTAFALQHGFTVTSATHGVAPYLHDKHSPMIQMLARVANEVTGDKAEPFTMSGGTYAHRLPNAYAFGMDGNLPPADFPAGHGGAHGRDEAVSLDRLQRAMHIYARALLELQDMTW